MDLSVFTTAEAWISLVALIFLEIVLGVDNLVFISLTTDRLPPEKQHIGRRVGLLGALCVRIILLCLANWLIHMTETLFTIDLGAYVHDFSLRDIILFVGGVYLIYKGIDELRKTAAEQHEAQEGKPTQTRPRIGLPRAVATIMAMDVVLSIDSVITAVGLANHLIVMILAVIIAVIAMMVLIDPIAKFLNSHVEMKYLALVFIAVVGVLLVLESLGIQSEEIEGLGMPIERLIVYAVMVVAIIITLLYMRRRNAKARIAEQDQDETIS